MKSIRCKYTSLIFGLFVIGLNINVFAQETRPVLSLQDLWATGLFFEDTFQGGQWTDEGPVITYTEADPSTGATHVISYDLERDDQTRLIDGSRTFADDVGRLIRIEDYTYNHDRSKVLIYADSAPVWRLNTKGFYYIFDIENQSLTPLSPRDRGYQMFAKFSPDGRYSAFVRDRNLFLVDMATMSEKQLTFDGADGTIIYGTTDWVYEEEFWLRDGWSWSPDSRCIAFYQFDESNTNEFVMADLRGLKPELIRFRFPLAGEANSEIRVGVYDTTSENIRYFDTDTWFEGGDDFEYIPRMGWTPTIDGKPYVWMLRMNRDQNNLDLLYGDPSTMEVQIILNEKEDTWITVDTFFFSGEKITYLNDGEHFIWRSEIDGWNHLYLYQNDGIFVRQVTKGEWEVSDFHGVDEEHGRVYFTGTAESPMERHLYRIPLDPPRSQPGRELVPERITTAGGTHTVNMSDDFRYFIDTYSTRNTPPVTTLYTSDGTPVKALETNDRLNQTLNEYQLPPFTFEMVPGADGTLLHAYMVKPSDFDSTRSYPLLIFTYGGPSAQSVTDAWDSFTDRWHTYLAEEHDIIVACVDNRGSSGRGKTFASVNYKTLGTVEAQDQIAAARYWGALPYIDATRIGIWGWSYGGENTLMSMFKYDGPETIKTGISVAPGTDHRLYDTIYTERFMSTPQKNPRGYAESSPNNFVGNMQDHQRLLIVQGDLDDNVHFQNTVHLISALQHANKQFQLMIYPGGNHGMAGTGNPYVYLHLFTTMTRFLVENL